MTKKCLKKYKYKIFIMIIALLIIVIISLDVINFINKKANANSNNLQFKTIKTTCDNFELSGRIAYDSSKTSIYISNITYYGKENKTTFYSIPLVLEENCK